MSTSVMVYSPESPRDMSPDVTSPYPDRPIRPLPKRRLRERLSPDIADSITYPPAPKSSTPLFYHPYTIREETALVGSIEAAHPTERERADEIERNYVSRRNGDELDSDEDETAYRSRIYSRHSVDTTGRSYRYVQKPDSKHPNPQPPASTASSVDGYDSFENTNNKKKRKIPTPGEANVNGAHILGEVSGSGISGVDDLVEDIGSIGAYHNTNGTVAQGISGSGRGRYGRARSGRSPLRTLSDATSNWGNSRSAKQRQPQWPSPSRSPGIISRSIANANAEKSPISPSTGQENMSLLHQQASRKVTPASTQFTFTCDSQVPNTLPWPGPGATSTSNQTPASRSMNTQATQTDVNSSAPHSRSNPVHGKQIPPAAQQGSNAQKTAQGQSAAPKKNKRRTNSKEYVEAARQRRHQQEVKNYHHPPSPEDYWICEFCEYERIFGTPPEALIRQYEMKDRILRKKEAEKKRLLEKAKQKGRKGKKGKSAPKSNTVASDRTSSGQQAQQPATMHQSQSQGTQSEEYYEDEYDDEYAQDDPPPPSPTAPPVKQKISHERPDPGKLLGMRPAGGTLSNGIPA